MQGPIFMREIVGTIEDGDVEICATADATYDAGKREVTVALDAIARRVVAAGQGDVVPPSWLPGAELVKEHLPREEAVSFARDVFKSWTRKVHLAVPMDQHLRV
jgi:hypothetical protein